MYFLLMASSLGLDPGRIIENPTPGFKLVGFTAMKKHTVHGDQDHKIELDIHAVSKDPEGLDLIAEVKTWDRPVGKDVIQKFIEGMQQLQLTHETAFIFYSEKGFTKGARELLRENNIMYTSYQKLAGPLNLKAQDDHGEI